MPATLNPALEFSHLRSATPPPAMLPVPDHRPDLDELEARYASDEPPPKKRSRRGGRSSSGVERNHRLHALYHLRRILIEVAPFCVCCGRTVQAANDQGDDYAQLFHEQLHCRRCYSHKTSPELELSPPPAALAAMAMATVAVAKDAADAAPITIELPAELWDKFSKRCQSQGISVSRVFASVMLSMPNQFARRLAALKVWEHSHAKTIN
jgi:hypothetical protein